MEAHEQLGACSRRAPHLDAARGIGSGQKGLRPRRVIAIDKGLFRAIHRNCLGVGGESGHGDAQLFRLLARTLEQRAPSPHGGTDGACQRVRPCIARYPHGGLDLVDLECYCGCRVSRELQGIILGIGHVRLVARCLPRAHLGIGESDLERVEAGYDLRQLCRRETMRHVHEFRARNVHVNQLARNLQGPHRHRFLRNRRIDVMARHKVVDHVEVGRGDTVEHRDPVVVDRQRGLGIRRAGECRRPGPFCSEFIQSKRAIVPLGKSPPAV